MGPYCTLVGIIALIIFWRLSPYSILSRIAVTILVTTIIFVLFIRTWVYSISIRSKNKELALLQKLAKKGFNGNLQSQIRMADTFLDPNNPCHNLHIGINWLTMAARQGDLSSQLRLTDILLADNQPEDHEGDREKKVALKEVYQWMLTAALEGNTVAKRKVGEMCYLGLGCAQSEGEAAVWFMKAADEKDPIANLWLAYLYLHGQGVPQDRVMGLACYFMAQRTGKTDEILKEKLISGLEEGQIQQAKSYAIEITDEGTVVQY